MPLYDYQVEPLDALVQSVLYRRGREFLLVFPRQSGKNEAAAHLQVYLLNVLQRVGGNIVFAAVGDGIGRAARRLDQRLDNSWNRGIWQKGANPPRRCLGEACVVFVSSHQQAHSRGETAHWLLIVDELQEQEPAHIEAVFTPMRAAENATALYLGTVRTRHDALWRKKESAGPTGSAGRRATRLHGVARRRDGGQSALRRFSQQTGSSNMAGSTPPFAAEYFLEPLDADGALFPARRQALMQGRYPRQRAPLPHAHYVATIDVAGQDEAANDPGGPACHPRPGLHGGDDLRTVAAAPRRTPAPGPVYQAVDIFVDQGSRHFEETPGQPRLADRLAAFLELWRVRPVVVDATGVGEGLAGWLAATLGAGRVAALQVQPPQQGRRWAAASSRSSRPAASATGGETSARPSQTAGGSGSRCATARYTIAPGQPLDTGLRWSVPAGVTIIPRRRPAAACTTTGSISAALVAELDRLLLAEGGWPGERPLPRHRATRPLAGSRLLMAEAEPEQAGRPGCQPARVPPGARHRPPLPAAGALRHHPDRARQPPRAMAGGNLARRAVAPI